jgi:DNA repair protein RadC
MRADSEIASHRAGLRGKLAERGVRSLTSLELVDILAGNGQRLPEEAALAVVGLLDASGSGLRPQELEGIPGLGKDGRCRLLAALELARRHLRDGGIRVGGPEDVAAIAADIIESPQENFFTLTLDGGGCLIRKRLVFRGTLNQTVVHPREVFVDAITDRAAGVVLVHNHPSGKVEPSREDEAVTERLVRVGRLVGIDVVDHVIVGRGGNFSFKVAGMLGG